MRQIEKNFFAAGYVNNNLARNYVGLSQKSNEQTTPTTLNRYASDEAF